MSDWARALKKYELEFFPERFGMLELIQSLTDTSMPGDTRNRIAAEIVQLPAFHAETVIKQLKVDWWGDNPMGCRMAWEALEAAAR